MPSGSGIKLPTAQYFTSSDIVMQIRFYSASVLSKRSDRHFLLTRILHTSLNVTAHWKLWSLCSTKIYHIALSTMSNGSTRQHAKFGSRYLLNPANHFWTHRFCEPQAENQGHIWKCDKGAPGVHFHGTASPPPHTQNAPHSNIAVLISHSVPKLQFLDKFWTKFPNTAAKEGVAQAQTTL